MTENVKKIKRIEIVPMTRIMECGDRPVIRGEFLHEGIRFLRVKLDTDGQVWNFPIDNILCFKVTEVEEGVKDD